MDDDNLINAILAASPEVRALYATLRRRGHGVKKAAELALGIGIIRTALTQATGHFTPAQRNNPNTF